MTSGFPICDSWRCKSKLRFRAAVAVWLSLLSAHARAQRLDVAGTVTCRDAVEGERLAADVLIVYAEDPSVRAKSMLGSGQFRLVFVRPRRIRGQNMTLEFWPNEQKEEHTWFVPPHPTHILDGLPAFVLPANVPLAARCNQISANVAAKAEARDNLQAAGFLSHFLQLLALIPAGAAAAPGEVVLVSKSRLPITHAEAGNESGALNLARTTDFPFLGFRYAPRTYAGSALLTNAAAIALGDGFEMHSNGALRRIEPYRLSVVADWADGKNFGVGLGYYFQASAKERAIQYGLAESTKVETWSHAHTFLLAPAVQLRPGLAVSVGPTLSLQYVERPTDIARTTTTYGTRIDGATVATRTEIDDEVGTAWRSRGRVDAAASFVYDLSANVRVGAGIQNLFGTTEVVAGQKRSGRTLGAGFATAYYRLQVGADFEYSEAHGADGSAGVSLFASNGLEFGAGFLSRGALYRLWTRLGPVIVAVARNQDDHWFVNVGGRARY